jgi:hypothetical protein
MNPNSHQGGFMMSAPDTEQQTDSSSEDGPATEAAEEQAPVQGMTPSHGPVVIMPIHPDTKPEVIAQPAPAPVEAQDGDALPVELSDMFDFDTEPPIGSVSE